MQGHRSVVGSSTGTIDFDHSAGSSSADISAEMFWSDQALQDILPSSGSSGVLHYSSSSGLGHNLSLWSHGEGSSSSLQNAAGCSEQKLENGLPLGSMVSDTVTGFQGWFNTPTYLSQDNTIPDNGSSHVVDRSLTLWGTSSEMSHLNQLTSCANVIQQNLNLNVRASGHSDNLVEPHNSLRSGFSGSVQRPASAATHSVVTPENARRFDSSYDACRLPLKRKFIEEDIGQSSASASTRSYKHEEGSSWHKIAVDNSDNDSNTVAPHTQSQPIYEISPSSIVSGSMPNVSHVESRRNSRRNLRLRLSSGVQHSTPVHIGSIGSAFTPSVDSRMQHSAATLPTSLSFAQEVTIQQPHPTSTHLVLPRNGQSLRRSRGSSSRSYLSGVVIGERSSVPSAETTLRMSRQMLEHHMHPHQLFQISRNRHLSASRVGESSTAPSLIQPVPNPSLIEAATLNSEPNTSSNMPAGCTWGPGHSFSSRQRTAEVAAGVSDYAGSSSNQSMPLSGAASGINSQRNQLAHRRLALLLQRRHTGLPGAAYSLQSLGAASDERSRLISEIWSALDSMRRGEPLRPEDMMILNQSGLFGMAAELHDRHRDMRLDVDNMSYEELLALEERIGNVNTGLPEEAVMKSLKQRKFAPTVVAAQSEETEPCCICQEEYNEGDELGVLDCGHNFHTTCIKQWLMVKNLCPICKTTGFASK